MATHSRRSSVRSKSSFCVPDPPSQALKRDCVGIQAELRSSTSVLFGDFVALGELARRLGKHPSTCMRWVLKGVRGHRLKTHFVGGRRYVLYSDLDEFFQALNATASRCSPTPDRRCLDRIDAQLDNEGL